MASYTVRETMLCSSSSLKGFERQVEVSNINIHKLPAEMKDRWKIFNTGKTGSRVKIIHINRQIPYGMKPFLP